MGQGDGFSHLQAIHTPAGWPKKVTRVRLGLLIVLLPILIITWTPASFRPGGSLLGVSPGGSLLGGPLWLCPSLCLSHPTPHIILLPKAAHGLGRLKNREHLRKMGVLNFNFRKTVFPNGPADFLTANTDFLTRPYETLQHTRTVRETGPSPRAPAAKPSSILRRT